MPQRPATLCIYRYAEHPTATILVETAERLLGKTAWQQILVEATGRIEDAIRKEMVYGLAFSICTHGEPTWQMPGRTSRK